MSSIEKIVSGGQTGVDRAALDVALALGVPCGGWCPKFRRAEDGRIPQHYPLIEASTVNYAERTALNVRDSDGTLILAPGPLTGGTALTFQKAKNYGRPVFVIDLDAELDCAAVNDWIQTQQVRVVNVAGPRESQQPGIHERASAVLRRLLHIEPTSPPTRKRAKKAARRKE